MEGKLSRRSMSVLIFLATVLGSLASPPNSNPEPDYLTRRNYMLEEESHYALGGWQLLDENEEAANKILMAAKNEETSRGFADVSTFLPSRNFMTVIEDIKNSPTFKIIQKIPKGAVLHVHDISLTSLDYLYGNITFRENLYICISKDSSIAFRFLKSAESNSDCASSTGWELLADLRANKSIADDVNTLVRNSLTMLVPDPVTAYSNIDVTWTVAERVFTTVGGLLSYRPVFIDYYYQGLKELREDNVLYVEVRTSLPTLYDLDGNTYGPLDVASDYSDTTNIFVEDHPDFIGAKLIYSTLRSITQLQLDEYLDTAASLKEKFPEFVVGIDLVGQEDKGRPLIDFADDIRNRRSDIKLFLHAGESNWNGLSTDKNLIDAVLLGTTRIGHGYALIKHPAVLDQVRQNNIAIEINPIANQIGHVSDLRNHPSSFLFAKDYAVVVSCDDPGLWGAVGLSYDWYEAFVGIMSSTADLRALKQLAINSIVYSAMSEAEKEGALALWKDQWAKFISDLVGSNVHTQKKRKYLLK